MTFGERIKLLRESRGLSQETLGDALGVPRSTVAHYETPTPLNQRFPRIERLMDIAKYFNVSIDFLVGMEANNNTDDEKFSMLTYEGEFTKEEHGMIVDQFKMMLDYAKKMKLKEDKSQ